MKMSNTELLELNQKSNFKTFYFAPSINREISNMNTKKSFSEPCVEEVALVLMKVSGVWSNFHQNKCLPTS